ncbi:carboxypeptidase M32 [Candidatus Bathyarchaeota archaeon]|nr:carboxypeptidase M32 [Candidatus Bathyarchaeota archaeon]
MLGLNNEIQSLYDSILTKYKEAIILQTASSILHWDMETKMPPRGIELRSQQLSVLELAGHKVITNPQNGRLLDSIEKHPNKYFLSNQQVRNLYLFKKVYDENTKLPDSLVSETAKQQTISINTWKKAKAAKDYNIFKEDLKKIIELKLEAAEILMDVKGTKTPYDALLDSYESKMSAEKINRIFNIMKKGLIEVINKINDSEKKINTEILEIKVPVNDQKKISQILMDYLGYDILSGVAGGRLDETEHPFTTGYYDDVRITTHYYEDKFTSSFYSVLHEGGHALYNQNIPKEYMYQPLGEASSYGIHESQSRMIENLIGRSPEFVSYILPNLKKIIGKPFKGIKLRDFYEAVNVVSPSKIRVEADEVTYGLHIIIRFEIEQMIFNGEASIEELPQIWNQKYFDYLGVQIENDSEGIMQDTHWASGLFGYFPSYALGNIYDGMFYKKMKRDIPKFKKVIKSGNFIPIKQWLKNNIHSKGNLYDPEDLIKLVTGENLTVKPYLEYLERKFSKIYNF